MLYVPFPAEFFSKQIHNKGTINVLQGGGSAEYGQRPYIGNFFVGPFPKSKYKLNVVFTRFNHAILKYHCLII